VRKRKLLGLVEVLRLGGTNDTWGKKKCKMKAGRGGSRLLEKNREREKAVSRTVRDIVEDTQDRMSRNKRGKR